VLIMKVIKIDKTNSEDMVGGIFEGGHVDVKTLIDKNTGSKEMKAAIVTFPAGARTKVHAHSREQILYILSGKGIVGNDKEQHVATPGMIFLIPAGEKHWHGATKETSLSHLYVYNSETETKY